MACFITIQNNTELNGIITDLQQNPGCHTHVRDIKMQNPFRTREAAWKHLFRSLEQETVDAVIVSQFVEQDLLISNYLLAPIRMFKGKRTDIKVGLILKPNFIWNRLVEPIELMRIPILDHIRCIQLQDAVNAQIQNLQNSIVFIEDTEEDRICLTANMTRDKFGNRPVRIVNFDDAHRILFEETLPSVFVIDLIEKFGRAMGPYTGLGLYLILRSTPRLQNVRPILFSARREKEETFNAFDGVFEEDNKLESNMNEFLKDL